MKSADLKKWLKAGGVSRDALARQCRVSKRTVDGWFAKDEIPEPAGALIEKIMTESLQMTLSIAEFKEILRQMELMNIKSIEEFVNLAVREKLKRGGKK